MQSDVRNYWTRQLSRRGFVRGAAAGVAGLTAVSLVGCSGDSTASTPTVPSPATPTPPPAATPAPTPQPPPETKTIRLALAACDAPFMIAERFLQDEGFTDIQFQGAPTVALLTDGKADLAPVTPPEVMSAVDKFWGTSKAVIAIGPLHPGCAEIWAPQSVATLKDVRGHTVVVNAKTLDDVGYSYLAMGLKYAGVDPSEVNFVADPAADLTQLFLDGKSDLLFMAARFAFAFRTNPANKGHVVLDQAMEVPWSQQTCCMITATADWLRANPVAAKRALRAIYRAADSLPQDRAAAAKVATDRGLFGGPANVEVIRGAANMVPYDWRKYEIPNSLRFHGGLLRAVGLLKPTEGEVASRAINASYFYFMEGELARELKR